MADVEKIDGGSTALLESDWNLVAAIWSSNVARCPALLELPIA